jgi:aminoglycoside phosphotransferase (APT) family kinase protein
MSVTDAELETVLGSRPLARRPWPYASSQPMEQLELAGDPPRRVLFKDLTATAALPRPGFLADPLREITAYREVLAGVAPDAPAHVASVAAPARAWLFVELLDGRPLWQEGDLEAWRAAARWLAGLHAAEPPAAARRLLRHDAGNLRRRVLLADWLPGVERIADVVAERLSAPPARLIHGEFTASNVLVQRTAGGIRIRPVDWELAGLGPAVLDLATLTAGGWSDRERAEIERAYRDACSPWLRPASEQLDLARLLLAAQWSGWCPGWQPPPEQRYDWRGQVRSLVERLGL